MGNSGHYAIVEMLYEVGIDSALALVSCRANDGGLKLPSLGGLLGWGSEKKGEPKAE